MGRREGAGGVSACLLAWVACRGARQGSSSLLPWALVGDRGHGGPAWAEVAPGQLRGCIGGPLSMASCSSKAAASLFKRTLALSPPPRAAGGGCGRCGASGSPCATSLGGGRLRSAGSRLLQPPLPPSSPPRFLAAQPHSPPLLFLQNSLSDGLRTCFRYLNQTSRSFAAVIQALDGELRNAVCIFYLVLRALDTVEDDMTISLEMKVPMLQNFHSYLYQPDWKFMESKEKDRQVLEDFPTISLEFRNLAKVYQDVIAEVCHKMGLGMAEFLEKKVDSKQDWDRYCHYVAGLVGIGLSQLFSASTLEDPIVGQDTELANSMGLFLQKTNIIRDYLEDQLEDREFWPREIWSKYAKKLSDLAKPENSDKAVQCLNELITNTLHHIPDVLIYLSRLKNQSVFHSCAILQVMAIATLAACYNNKQVFQGVVKIRKGQAVTLMMDATNIDAVKAIMYQYVEEIYQKIPSTDPSSSRTHQVIASIRSLSMPSGALLSRVHYSPIYLSCAMLLAALSWQYLSTVLKMTEEYIHTGEN
ncbi:squalene synthase-like isoform X3 [Sphaerodactylus townsendi]|uniref:squalene synthase-like isoform X3 n=1 Tax=Sphaerodactylus townsendi TaxID=933632 RepID=UPI0020264EAD|nr:squalene synthase-like isoform X3 [Sphaerodactylus townsendi]